MLKKNVCEILSNRKILVKSLKNGGCRIMTPFTVLSTQGKVFKIKFRTEQLNGYIEHIKKSDLVYINEKYNGELIQENIDKDTEAFAKINNVNILLAVRSGSKLIVARYGLPKEFEFELKLRDSKGLSLGMYLDNVHGLVQLEDDAFFISNKYSGTILEALQNDSDDQFFRLLMTRLNGAFRHDLHNKFNFTTTVESFAKIAKNEAYVNNFEKLRYWDLIENKGEQVVQLRFKNSGVNFLLLYFRQQELVIALGVKNPNFSLSLQDKRIRHFVNAIMQDKI